MRPNFCEYIIKARHDKNLSQVEAAKKIGVTQAQICNIEKGIHFPSVETLINMSVVYDVTMDDLLGIKRDRNITVVLGDINSERRFITLMDRYHKNVLNQELYCGPESELEDRFLSSIELFKYGESVFAENLTNILTSIKFRQGKVEIDKRNKVIHDALDLRNELIKNNKSVKKVDKYIDAQNKENSKQLTKTLKEVAIIRKRRK